MQIKVATTNDPAKAEFSYVSITCTEAPLLLWELISFLKQGYIKAPELKKTVFRDEKGLSEVEVALCEKWSSDDFISLTNPIYSFCVETKYYEMKDFLNKLGKFLCADIFQTHFFWKELRPNLEALSGALGEWSFGIDPLDYFSIPTEELGIVEKFIALYSVSSPEELSYNCNKDSVNNDIAKLMDYNRDMEYAYYKGVRPCALMRGIAS